MEATGLISSFLPSSAEEDSRTSTSKMHDNIRSVNVRANVTKQGEPAQSHSAINVDIELSRLNIFYSSLFASPVTPAMGGKGAREVKGARNL